MCGKPFPARLGGSQLFSNISGVGLNGLRNPKDRRSLSPLHEYVSGSQLPELQREDASSTHTKGHHSAQMSRATAGSGSRKRLGSMGHGGACDR